MKREVMLRAWRIFRNYPSISFADALKRSWQIQKENRDFNISKIKLFFINRLSIVNRKTKEDTALMCSTIEHFKLLRSKNGKSILKLNNIDNDSYKMLVDGELIVNDMFNQKKKEQLRHKKSNKKIKTKFRNRIINYQNCEKINVDDYIRLQNGE
jgi:hypothetical protein